MLYFERQKKILELIKKHECVTVEFLCERIYASPATVRRDLSQMFDGNLITRVRGGAAILEGSNHDEPSLLRFTKNVEKKKKIAAIAMRYIKNSNTLFLDSSSTSAFLAKELKAFQDLSVVTNGIQTINILSKDASARVFACGGLVIGDSSITGPEALRMIKNFRADILFFSCVGFSLSSGITDALQENAAVKREMIANSRKRILLCDSTKMNQEYFSRVCDSDEVDLIITDSEPPSDILNSFRYKTVFS